LLISAGVDTVSLNEKLRIALWFSAAALAMALLLGSGRSGTEGCASLSDGSWFHREYCAPAHASAPDEASALRTHAGSSY
jgi:hypothetical protein